MTYLLILLSFVLGSIIGSFLNVVSFRYNTGRSVVKGRSACLSCGKKLSWYELIPVISFFASGRKCLSCGSAISWQYPTVEIITGLVFAAVVFHADSLNISLHAAYGILYTAYYFLAFSLIIAITVYDLKHKIIPDRLVWALVFVSFIKIFILGAGSPNLKYDILAGPVLALPFALIWFFSKGRAMGLGDAKLSLGIGFMLGLAEGISALFLSFWVGGLVSVFLLLGKRGGFTMKSEVPFAPFLALGALAVYLFNLDFLGIKNLLF